VEVERICASDKSNIMEKFVDAMKDPGANLKTPSLPSVPRALDVLDHVATSQNGLTLTQLTRVLGFPRSTMYCLLLTLERSGYIQRNAGRGPYLCGPRLLELSGKTLAGSSLRGMAMPSLRSLMQRTRLATHMATLDGDQVRIIAQLAPVESRLVTSLGQYMDLHCTALGKAIAAFLPESQVDAIISRRALVAHNERTISSHRRFFEELALTRQRGFAVDDEEDAIGYRCMAAPVLDHSRMPLAAVSVLGTTTQITIESFPALGSDLKHAAERISASLLGKHQAVP
jgi:DNA-binding IclR family transcriptional regulator